jgi:hypothetical protein
MKIKWILFTTVVLGIAAFFYLKLRKSEDFEHIIKAKLIDLVQRGSNGLYVLSIRDLEIDILQSTATVRGLTIKPDSISMKVLDEQKQLSDDIFSIQVSTLHIDGLSPTDFINTSSFDLKQIRVDSANIVVTHRKRKYNTKDSSSFYSRIAPNQESYALQMLLLNKVDLHIVNKDKAGTIAAFKNVRIQLASIKIDKTTLNDSTRFLFAKDASLYLGNYIGNTNNKKYTFSIDSVALKPQLGSMKVKGLRLKPVDSKTAFNDKLRFQEDQFDIAINELNFQNINWWSFLSNDGLFADAAEVNGGFVNIYRDKTLPLSEESKVGKFPHQELMNLPFPIHVNKLALQDFSVRYEEFNPKSMETGKVEFNHVKANIQNISNMPEVIQQNNWMKVSTTSIFMNQAQLDANIHFDLGNCANGNFTVNFVLGKMNGTHLNQISEGLGMIKVEKLAIEKLAATVQGNNMFATGDVSFAYNDLTITALKKDDDNRVKKKRFASYMANKFLINSKSDGKKVQHVRYERDSRKSFFNLIWKTVNKGVTETVIGK